MSIRPVIDEQQNGLLSALPRVAWDSLRPHLTLVSMPNGRLIGNPNGDMSSAYFPLTCSISLLAELDDGTTLEVATIGHEGMLGVSALIGAASTPTRALVKFPGFAYRIKATLLQSEFDRSILLRRSLLSYVQALVLQLGQSAACYRRHTVMQQFCRYVLTNLDSSPSSSAMPMTHQSIAHMLGVRRESITTIIGKLQKLGFIRCSRGQLSVLDRPALEAHACECYDVIRTAFERMGAQNRDQRGEQRFAGFAAPGESTRSQPSGSRTRRDYVASHAAEHGV